MVGQPIARFRAGQVVSALWENEANVKGKAVTILKATVQRRYKDQEGNWQSSNSLNRNEILLAIYCLQKAFERIVAMQNEGLGTNKVDDTAISD